MLAPFFAILTRSLFAVRSWTLPPNLSLLSGTLTYVSNRDQAKKIKNKAVVNEDPNAKLIRELKEELAVLRSRMTGASTESTYNPDIPPEKQIVQYRNKSGEIRTISKADLQDQLEASEKLMASVTETWEEKLVRAQEVQKERETALEALGITIEKNQVGVHAPKKVGRFIGFLQNQFTDLSPRLSQMPHLVNLNEDALMAECLVCMSAYSSFVTDLSFTHDLALRSLKRSNQTWQDSGRFSSLSSLHSILCAKHSAKVGNVAAEKPADIRLSGASILPEHCHFDSSSDGKVTISSRPNSTTMVNGQRISPDKVWCFCYVHNLIANGTATSEAQGAKIWLSYYSGRLSRLSLQVRFYHYALICVLSNETDLYGT